MEIVQACKALADESRLRLINVLSQGLFNVQELTSILELGQSTISHHLKILQGCGIVSVRREGTWAYYTIVQKEGGTFSGVGWQILELVESGQDEHLAQLTRKDLDRVRTVLSRRRDETKRYFDTVAASWHETHSGSDASYLDMIAGLIPMEGTLAELGCGSGVLLEKVLPRKGPTIGIDYSQAMLEEARRNLRKFDGELDLRLGYLEHLPLGDACVDTAVACMVMHHISRPVEVLSDIARVLKPGGTLLVVDLLRHDREEMRERHADLWLGFETAEFRTWLEKAGFVNSRIEIPPGRNEIFILNSIKRRN